MRRAHVVAHVAPAEPEGADHASAVTQSTDRVGSASFFHVSSRMEVITIIPQMIIVLLLVISFFIHVTGTGSAVSLAQRVPLINLLNWRLFLHMLFPAYLSLDIVSMVHVAKAIATRIEKQLRPRNVETWATAASAAIPWYGTLLMALPIAIFLISGVLLILAYYGFPDRIGGYGIANASAVSILFPLLIPLRRNFVVGMVRRNRERMAEKVDGLQERAVRVLLLQCVCITCVGFTAHWMAPMTHSLYSANDFAGSVSVSVYSTQCLRDVNASYMQLHCDRNADIATFLTLDGKPTFADFRILTSREYSATVRSGGELRCHDGGVDNYHSLFDACQALVDTIWLERIAWDGFWVCFISTLLLLVVETIQGIDVSVNRFTVFTQGSVLLSSAASLGMISAVGSLILFMDMIGGFIHRNVLTFFWWVPITSAILSLVLLFVEFTVHKFKEAKAETPAERKLREEVEKKQQDEQKRGTCRFWFVHAEHVRAWTPTPGETSLPSFQKLQLRGWLVSREISLSDACRGSLVRDYLAVSHRWFAPQHPDEGGQQMQIIKAHLERPENMGIQYVWYE